MHFKCVFTCNRMISRAINKKTTSRKDEGWFYAFSCDELFFVNRTSYLYDSWLIIRVRKLLHTFFCLPRWLWNCIAILERITLKRVKGKPICKYNYSKVIDPMFLFFTNKLKVNPLFAWMTIVQIQGRIQVLFLIRRGFFRDSDFPR